MGASCVLRYFGVRPAPTSITKLLSPSWNSNVCPADRGLASFTYAFSCFQRHNVGFFGRNRPWAACSCLCHETRSQGRSLLTFCLVFYYSPNLSTDLHQVAEASHPNSNSSFHPVGFPCDLRPLSQQVSCRFGTIILNCGVSQKQTYILS